MSKKSIEYSINEEARYLLDCFADHVGKPFDPTHLVSNAVSNIICKICFGYRFNYSDLKFAELIARLREITSPSPASLMNVFSWIIYTPHYDSLRKTIKRLMAFIHGIIQVKTFVVCICVFSGLGKWYKWSILHAICAPATCHS